MGAIARNLLKVTAGTALVNVAIFGAYAVGRADVAGAETIAKLNQDHDLLTKARDLERRSHKSCRLRQFVQTTPMSKKPSRASTPRWTKRNRPSSQTADRIAAEHDRLSRALPPVGFDSFQLGKNGRRSTAQRFIITRIAERIDRFQVSFALRGCNHRQAQRRRDALARRAVEL